MSDKIVADDIRVRVFLEGIYFPYASMITTTSTPSDNTMMLSVPPSKVLKPELMYGMTVQVFYANSRVLELRGDDPREGGKSEWPILFEGEIRGVNTVETVSSQSVMIQCVSVSRHFDQTHLYFLDPDQESNIYDFTNRVIFLGNSSYIPNLGKGPLEQRQIFQQKLKERIDSFDAKSSDRFIALAGMNSDVMRMAAKNASFSIMDARFRLSERFGSFIDPDVKKILSLQELATLFEKKGSQLPTYSSVRQVQNILTDMMQYDWIHIAQPHFSTVGDEALQASDFVDDGPLRDVPRLEFTKTDIYYDSEKTSESEIRKIEDSVDQLINESVALVNPNEEYIVNLPVGRILLYAGYLLRGSHVTKTVSKRVFTQTVVDKIVQDNLSAKDAFQSVASSGTIPEKTTASSLEEQNNEAQKDREILGKEYTSVSTEDEVTAIRRERERINSRLNQFISVPNMEFSQPPRCNVLMPHHMSAGGINIDHFASPTRIYGVAKFIKDGPTEFYMAPVSTTYFHVENNRLAVWDEVYKKENRKRSKKKAKKV